MLSSIWVADIVVLVLIHPFNNFVQLPILFSDRLLITLLKVIAIPTAYAVVLRLLFGVKTWKELYSVMSVTFLFCLPTIVGALTVYLSKPEQAKNRSYMLLAPWLPVILFFALTIVTGLEGWGCWIMVLPLFLAAASIGGVIGAHFKQKKRNDKAYMSVLTILPLFISPVENLIGAIPGTYQANTYIDIQAPAEKIWSKITRVREIPEEQDKGWLTRALGFPRPLKAELNYDGVGGYRQAIYTNGLVFHERVTKYDYLKKMEFTIRAHPDEIPPTTLDEHVVIGGAFFDVLHGSYELEKLNQTTYRLHLTSNFKLTTTFNFYASWWAKWILEDIQNNILQIEKHRAETE